MTILQTQKHRRIFDGLPIFCQQHPPAKLVCMTRTDFWTFAPDGGCTTLCGATLKCGHLNLCPRSCHAYDPDHSTNIRCRIIVADECSAGHKISRECWKPAAKVICTTFTCEIAIEEQKRIERERLTRHCEKDQRG